MSLSVTLWVREGGGGEKTDLMLSLSVDIKTREGAERGSGERTGLVSSLSVYLCVGEEGWREDRPHLVTVDAAVSMFMFTGRGRWGR